MPGESCFFFLCTQHHLVNKCTVYDNIQQLLRLLHVYTDILNMKLPHFVSLAFRLSTNWTTSCLLWGTRIRWKYMKILNFPQKKRKIPWTMFLSIFHTGIINTCRQCAKLKLQMGRSSISWSCCTSLYLVIFKTSIRYWICLQAALDSMRDHVN